MNLRCAPGSLGDGAHDEPPCESVSSSVKWASTLHVSRGIGRIPPYLLQDATCLAHGEPPPLSSEP